MTPMSATMLRARDPRSGVWADILPQDSGATLSAQAARLRSAQPAWRTLDARARASALARFADVLADRRAHMVAALLADTGRVRESELEIDASIATLRRWAAQAPELLEHPPPRSANVPFIEQEQRSEPFALVGVISPWNFPLLLALIDAVPALLAGCAVLIKPSEVTPRFIAPLREALELVPPLAAVTAVLAGAGDLGAALVGEVDLVCFTGSVATGRRVGEACAQRFIPAFLELGGKDAALVLEDADIVRAARALCWAGMVNAGQSCMSIERIYAAAPIFDAFVNALTSEVGKLRLNYPDPADGEIGPVIAQAQVGIVRLQLEDALARGARALTGGAVVERDGGWWCQPTVLVDVSPEMRLMREETFAAVLPVMRVADDDEAVRLANATEFGLSAAVFSADRARAAKLAERLEAGAISINDAALTSLVHSGEKQSFKHSGMGGSRMGPASIRRFLRQKLLLVNPGVEDPWWF